MQQLPIVRAAGALGFAVIGVDRDPDAPAFSFCDARVVASTHDPEATLAGLLPLRADHDVRGVLVRSAGPPVVTAAEVGRAFGVPGVPPASARTIVDKERFLAACAEAGLPAPAARSGEALADLDLTKIGFPCVVKPALGLVGKRAVRMVSDPRALPEAFEAARQASVTGRVNVEAWVPGYDVGLVSVVRGGALHPITLIDEWNDVDTEGSIRPRGVSTPSRFSGTPTEARLLALAEQVIAHFQLDTTALMMACRLRPDGSPILTEIHLDLGGDRILDDLLPASSACDVILHLVSMLSGHPTEPLDGLFQPAGIVFDECLPIAPAPLRRRSARVLIAPDRLALDMAMGRV